MWASISKPWQAAFEQAWEAKINGSLPIGAVITDENGVIISYGQNRTGDRNFSNSKIAHAETDALQKLDITKYPNIHSYTLYTTAEPCPMCFGTLAMSGLRELRVAARDKYAGATHFNSDPYIAIKNIQISFDLELLEMITHVLGAYFSLRIRDGEINVNSVMKKILSVNPEALTIAKSLYAEKRLDWHIANSTPFGRIFDEIAAITGEDS